MEWKELSDRTFYLKLPSSEREKAIRIMKELLEEKDLWLITFEDYEGEILLEYEPIEEDRKEWKIDKEIVLEILDLIPDFDEMRIVSGGDVLNWEGTRTITSVDYNVLKYKDGFYYFGVSISKPNYGGKYTVVVEETRTAYEEPAVLFLAKTDTMQSAKEEVLKFLRRDKEISKQPTL